MFKTILSLKLRFLSIRSFIVLSVCSYYFVGMQVSTVENIDPFFLTVYKLTFISGIIMLFALYFILNRRKIIYLLSSRNSILTLVAWICLILFTKQPSLIFMLIIVMTFYEKNYKMMAGYLFVWLSCLFSLFALLSSLGLIKTGEILKYNLLTDSSNFQTVTALGMGNPNTAMSFLLGIIMTGAYIFFDTKFKNRYAVIMILLSVKIYTLVGSRTGIIVAAIFLFMYLVDVKRLRLLLKQLIPLIMLIIFISSIFVGIKYGHSDNKINDLLTTRPQQWNLRLHNGALKNVIGNSDNFITLVGNKSERYPLDNQFIYLLARSGWIILLSVFAIYFIGLRKNKNPVVTYMLFSSVILCFVESIMFTAIVNIGLLFVLSSLLLRDDESVTL